MPQYKFYGRSSQGQTVEGKVEASSHDAVAKQLVNRGITLVRLESVKEQPEFVVFFSELLKNKTIPSTELVMFCRQMFTITKSGIPLTRGIRGLAASLRNPVFHEALMDVADKLETGMSLSQAMSRYPNIFDQLFISMISVGETSGKLDEVFRQIAYYIEKDDESKKRVKSAIRYPLFVLATLAVALAIVNIFVIPAFADLFENFGAELPFVTQILIGLSNFFVHYWAYLVVVCVVGIVGAIRYLDTEAGAYFWGRYQLKMPVVGGLFELSYMARYSRSFALMLQAGVPLNQCLGLCSSVIGNAYFAEKIIKIRQSIERGDSLFRTHSQAEMFTPLVLQMISVGEESGQVDVLLKEVAEFYEREVDYDLKTLTDRIEPILIISMAVFVLILALGIFLPMWSMYDVQKG